MKTPPVTCFRSSMATLVLIACAALLSAPAAAQGQFQAADVFALPPTDPLELTGAAWLNRTKERIQGRIMTKVDRAGFAHTVWIVIFNNPEECAAYGMGAPCMDSDLFNPDVGGEVYYGSAAISALSPPGGVINVDLAIRDVGLPEGIFHFNQFKLRTLIFPDKADGLDKDNGMCAEIHLVVDYHPGPVRTDLDSWVPDLTRTDFPVPGEQVWPSVLGATGIRAAIFPGVCAQK